ncbi:MAG: aspartate ammonia-lyase [Spirochaetaceae bacterium]|jgi:aspartate ammonia-lyase|nr:aspartate ammonia-lyase [Spirochaetaceae bacterium]
MSRIERDSLGEREIPSDAAYGIRSLRACENFALDYKKTNPRLIRGMVLIKKAAALSYDRIAAGEAAPSADLAGTGDGGAAGDGETGKTGAGPGEREKYRAIAAACDRVLAGEAADMFILDALQGGAGTSTNMNVNEVIANIALSLCGKQYGDYGCIHPLDDVNRGQSTNDVYPTALRIAAIELLRELSEGCAKLQEALQKRENEFEGIKKLGRTELMDAVPITLGAEFGAWAQAIGRDRWRLYKAEERLRQVNLGGTAVGRGDNAGRKYRFTVIEILRELTGLGLAAAEYPMDITQNNDVFVEVSGLLKALAVNMMKIAGDLRLMNSGPGGGLGEIRLAPLQEGSTIMPGKVNPVIPEMVIQSAIRVIANDQAITLAASRGEFELNSFFPLIADALLESLSLLSRTVFLFRANCIELLVPDRERCLALLEASTAFAAAWVPVLGYDRVSAIVAKYGGDPARCREALEAEGDSRGRREK